MNSYEFYCNYVGLKAHFNHENYDFFKYNKKSKLSPKSFEKRKDGALFRFAAKSTDDPVNFLLANLLDNPKVWIGDLIRKEAQETYYKWKGRQENKTYLFQGAVRSLSAPFEPNIKVLKTQHPPLLTSYIANKISLENLIYILEICNGIRYWNRELKEDLIWPSIEFKIRKYRPFLDYDQEKFRKILVQHFLNDK